MDELLLKALDLAKMKGAEYADIRLVNTTQERLVVRNGVVDTLSNDQSTGFGVRVLVNGSWGFASSQEAKSTEIDRVTDLAVQIANASGLQSKEPVNLGPPISSRGTYTTPIQVDPFKVSSHQSFKLYWTQTAAWHRSLESGPVRATWSSSGKRRPLQTPKVPMLSRQYTNPAVAFRRRL